LRAAGCSEKLLTGIVAQGHLGATAMKGASVQGKL
jgi:hypothetical protein